MKRIDEGAPSDQPAPTWHVLYVEDEPSNWEVTELRLRKKFKLLWARTDEEACALVRQYGPQLYAVFVAEFTAEWNRLQASANSDLQAKRSELAEVRRRSLRRLGWLIPRTQAT